MKTSRLARCLRGSVLSSSHLSSCSSTPFLLTSQHRTFYTHPVPGSFRYVREPRTVSIIGAPLADGQPLAGVALGPSFMRRGGLSERLKRDGWLVHDWGDLDFHAKNSRSQLQQPPLDTLASTNTSVSVEDDDKNTTASATSTPVTTTVNVYDPSTKNGPFERVKFPHVVGPASKLIFDAVGGAIREGHIPVLLGGDHSIAIGSLSAVLHSRAGDTGIIWVDAHADINTPASSASGNIHGMVLSFVCNLQNARSVPGFEWMNGHHVPVMDPRNIVYIGLRDLDPPEKNLLRSLNVRAFTMKDIDKYGIAKVMEMAQDYLLNRRERPIHLSFDIDSLDPAYAPSTGTRVSGGLSYREAYYICESVADTGMLSSMDLAEVNPELESDRSDMTVKLAVGLISSTLGNTIL